jgi:hypothetical protein
MIGAMPDTRGRGTGEDEQNPKGAVEAANRKGISPIQGGVISLESHDASKGARRVREEVAGKGLCS